MATIDHIFIKVIASYQNGVLVVVPDHDYRMIESIISETIVNQTEVMAKLLDYVPFPSDIDEQAVRNT